MPAARSPTARPPRRCGTRRSCAPISETAMLEIRDLSLHYGPHLALDRISVAVGKGETVVMLGANGAGKSSLLKAAAGLVRPDPGADIRFAGADIAGRPAHLVPEAGIALVPEGRGVFGGPAAEGELARGAAARRAPAPRKAA